MYLLKLFPLPCALSSQLGICKLHTRSLNNVLARMYQVRTLEVKYIGMCSESAFLFQSVAVHGISHLLNLYFTTEDIV